VADEAMVMVVEPVAWVVRAPAVESVALAVDQVAVGSEARAGGRMVGPAGAGWPVASARGVPRAMQLRAWR
jgi:hypothetical protein